MLRIENFVSSLLPNFEVNRITTNIDNSLHEYNEIAIPAYKAVLASFEANKRDMLLPDDFEGVLRKHLLSYKDSGIASIAAILNEAPGKGLLFKDLLAEYMDTYVTKDGLTYAKANIIQLTEIFNFTAEYARRLLLFFMNYKNDFMGEGEKDKTLARERKWLYKGITAFAASLNIIAMEEAELKSKIKNIPDMTVVAGTIGDVRSSVGANKVDPLKIGFIPYKFNPIYHVRILIVEWEEARLRKAKAEKESIELLLIHLEADKGKPKIKRQYEYNQDRLRKINKKIHEMEEDAEDED